MPIEPVPPETVRVARAAFPKGHRYLRLADELDALFRDDAFATLFPTHGQPALPPWRLALATILQFAAGLSDRQAANAVREALAVTIGHDGWRLLSAVDHSDTPPDGRRAERAAARRVVRGDHAGPDTYHTVGAAAGGCLRGMTR